MCLLIINKKDTVFSDKFLEGVYQRNEDGLGIMYAEDGVLHVKRILPENAKQAINFYREHAEGRDCVTHWRMRTHGDINLANCHPYEVFGNGSEMPIFMAHNGVLSTGNMKDRTLSDTWHYIEDYIKPLVSANPSVVFSEAFIKLVSGHIGASNKFAFMNHMGQIAVCNEHAFTKYEGSLLSNTYAWDYYGLHPSAPAQHAFNYPPRSYGGSGYSGYSKWLDDSTTTKKKNKSKVTSIPKGGVTAKIPPVKADKRPVAQIVQELMDRIEFISPDVGESLLFSDMAKCVKLNGEDDVTDLVEMLEYGYVAEEAFRTAITEPDKLVETLNEAIKVEAGVFLEQDIGGAA